MAQTIPTLAWQGDVDGHLVLLHQTRLPGEIELLDCIDADQVWIAIRELQVQGAPANGIAASCGVCQVPATQLRRAGASRGTCLPSPFPCILDPVPVT